MTLRTAGEFLEFGHGPDGEREVPNGPLRSGLAGRKILIVEDDVPLRNALVRAFERELFEARTAAALKEACEIAYSFTPEFAVLDLSLGGGGHGMESVSHLREARPDVRIVVITGYDSIASSLVALKAGVIDYLAKPVRVEQVVAAIMGRSGEPAASDYGDLDRSVALRVRVVASHNRKRTHDAYIENGRDLKAVAYDRLAAAVPPRRRAHTLTERTAPIEHPIGGMVPLSNSRA